MATYAHIWAGRETNATRALWQPLSALSADSFLNSVPGNSATVNRIRALLVYQNEQPGKLAGTRSSIVNHWNQQSGQNGLAGMQNA